MKVKVKNRLVISEPDPAVRAYCEKNLIIDNPDFYKKERLGKWTGDTPRKLQLFEKMDDEWWLPFGCFQDVWSIHPVKADFSLEICPVRHEEYESSINLYPYQEIAVTAALRAKNGILVMPCGSGKTQCGLELIARIGGRALWLTHTQDLLNQSKKRAESVLSGCGFGTITAGRVVMGSHITFATVQTMAKLDLSAYRDQWDVIVVDEAQHCAGSPTRVTQFYKVISQLSARYKYGLTATPKRADGLEGAMFALLGGKIHEVTREEVAHTTCPVRVRIIETGWMPDYNAVLMGDGMIDYNRVIDDMIHDKPRFYMVADTVKSLDGPAMVLGNRVEYLQLMSDLMSTPDYDKRSRCLSGQGQSKRAKAERKAALEMLNSGQLDVIFATYALAKEGLDVPNLRYVVFATPEQDETTVIQSAGRVGRKAEGKECGIVIDYVDDFGMYRGWLKKRKSHYKKIGVEVEA